MFLCRAAKIHGDKYRYRKVNYLSARRNVIITCPLHGDFLQTPDNHLHGRNCPQCSIQKRALSRSSTLQEFIDKAKKVHHNKYEYSKSIYTNCDSKITITCPIHGDFHQSPYCHLIGKGCPDCNSSKGELKISQWLTDNKIPYVSQKIFIGCKNPKTGRLLKFDFFIPSKNILIEYDGEQHFSVITSRNYMMTKNDLLNNRHRDRIKTAYARRKGITLLRIKYTQFHRIDDILSNVLNKN